MAIIPYKWVLFCEEDLKVSSVLFAATGVVPWSREKLRFAFSSLVSPRGYDSWTNLHGPVVAALLE